MDPKDKQTITNDTGSAETGESFADLFNDSPVKKKTIKPGQKIEAEVVSISKEYVFLDVGDKSEGYITREELEDDNGDLTVKTGDFISVFFLSSKGSEKLFTTKVGGTSTSAAHLEDAYANGIPVEGLVQKEIKGGYEITLSGSVRAFCPYSQMGFRRAEDPQTHIGDRYTFKITKYSENGRNIVVSRRAILAEEREQKKEELKKTLTEGMTIRGEVTSIRDFGAFVDIGGIDALIPISEISMERVENINDYLTVGQKVEAIILNLDWENNRVALSLKAGMADPWESIEEKFQIGSCCTGRVARLLNFGAFVTLEPGVDGLVHISKLGCGKRINHPREVVVEGQTIEVRIESIDLEKKRVALDMASEARKEAEQQEAVEDYKEHVNKADKPASIGSLGEILQKKLQEKNNR